MNINENVTMLLEILFASQTLSAPNWPLPIKSPDDQIQIRKIYLEDNPEMQHKVLQEIHDSPIGGYPGISNTWHLVKRQYIGPRLCKFVKDYIKGCAKCQESKVMTHVKRAPLII